MVLMTTNTNLSAHRPPCWAEGKEAWGFRLGWQSAQRLWADAERCNNLMPLLATLLSPQPGCEGLKRAGRGHLKALLPDAPAATENASWFPHSVWGASAVHSQRQSLTVLGTQMCF